MPAVRRRRALLALCLAIVYLTWGSTYAVVVVGLRDLPPFLFGGVRFFAGGVLLLGLSLAIGNRPVFDRGEWRRVAWVALGAVVVSNGTNTWAMQWVPSNQAALLNATAALWIAGLGAFGRRAQPLDRLTVCGLLLGFAGTIMIVLRHGALQWSGALLPELIVLVGVLGWSLATIYLRNSPPGNDLLTFTAVQMLLGGSALLAIGIGAGELPRWHWGRDGLLALAYMTLLSSGIAYTAYAWLTQHATPAVVGTYSYVNPAIAAIVGWWLLDERLGPWQTAGMLVILASVVLVTWRSAEAPSRAAIQQGHRA
ncbi:MAG: EamA family transporter [Steroidobacteraceae bacterium]|nr:EamA family transporter [Steroidobacteraceae bacterium]MDW8258273.1 EamA family transporter [Gammaproteobacteria bacterium]